MPREKQTVKKFGRKPFKSRGEGGRRPPRRKVCFFCAEKQAVVDYKNPSLLVRYVSDRGRIEPRRKTGACAKHQRSIAEAIKRARYIALLPYFPGHAQKATGVPLRSWLQQMSSGLGPPQSEFSSSDRGSYGGDRGYNRGGGRSSGGYNSGYGSGRGRSGSVPPRRSVGGSAGERNSVGTVSTESVVATADVSRRDEADSSKVSKKPGVDAVVTPTESVATTIGVSTNDGAGVDVSVSTGESGSKSAGVNEKVVADTDNSSAASKND